MSLCVDGLPFLYETLARFMSLLCPLTCSTSLFCWSYQAFEPGLIDIALLVFALDRVSCDGGVGLLVVVLAIWTTISRAFTFTKHVFGLSYTYSLRVVER